MENFTPYIVIFVLLVGIPIFVRFFFRKNSEDSNVTDRMLEWQQKKQEFVREAAERRAEQDEVHFNKML